MTSPRPWTSERVFHGAREFYDAVLKDVERARETLDLEVYIFDDDEVGRRVQRALEAAARRGVTVRVLADGFGSRGWGRRFVPGLLEAGVDARLYRPMPWLFLRMGAYRIPSLARILGLFGTLTRRNHRKVWIIDGHIAHVGSINVTAKHLAEVPGASAWRDTAVRVEGEPVAELQWGFLRAWSGSWRFRPVEVLRSKLATPRAPSGLVRLNDSRRARRSLNLDLVRRMAAARERIWITNPYFIPAPRMVARLCQAAHRHGADVRLLVPQHPDVPLVRWVTATFYDVLLRSGVRIFEYIPAVLHAKIVQIDAWTTVGSSNLDDFSLLHNLEVDLVITDADARSSVDRQFALDLAQSEEITLASLHERPWLDAVAGRFFRLFRTWM